MKKLSSIILSMFIISFFIGCQGSKDDNIVTNVKPDRNANARRACGNSIIYRFLYPSNDYSFDGFGCQHFYVHRGATRQFTVVLTNSAPYSQNVSLQIEHPDNPGYIQYTVASYTGGSISIANPVPGTSAGEAIVWQDTAMPAFTSYQLTFNVTGVTGSAAAENGVRLQLKQPCNPDPISDCDADENLHLILTD